MERSGGTITHCGGWRLRHKGWCRRKVRHDDWGFRRGILDLEVRKSRCLDCGRCFRQRLPGVQPCQRASESFQEMIYQQHLDGVNRSCLGRRKGIGAATVQRYFLRRLQRRARQDHPPACPKVLGIDEHFFTRKKGYATTFCDLKNHRIYREHARENVSNLPVSVEVRGNNGAAPDSVHLPSLLALSSGSRAPGAAIRRRS
jgi:transposase